jgi:hypothetical protein
LRWMEKKREQIISLQPRRPSSVNPMY